MSGTLLSFGHGYSAAALTRRLGRGWRVIGTTRRPEKALRLRNEGLEAHLWPGDELAPAIREATHILVSIAPDAAGDPVLVHHAHALAADVPNLLWLGYLSTTGVYGDHAGGWVLDVTDWMYLMENGTIINRSQFRKFGIKVAELVATMRQVPA